MEWFKVAAYYYDDLVIQRIGERAETLFMRGLAWSAGADTDGYIPETQVPRFGLPQVAVRVAALVMAGLWDEAEGGYQVRNWFVWQSQEYAAERKRQRDRNRQRSLRGVARQSHESRPDVAGLEVEEETNPLTPSSEGGSCNGQHDNCRTCGTTRRQQAKTARLAKPPWCGGCEETTRLVGWDSDTPSRCPQCHPALRADNGSGIVQQDVG